MFLILSDPQGSLISGRDEPDYTLTARDLCQVPSQTSAVPWLLLLLFLLRGLAFAFNSYEVLVTFARYFRPLRAPDTVVTSNAQPRIASDDGSFIVLAPNMLQQTTSQVGGHCLLSVVAEKFLRCSVKDYRERANYQRGNRKGDRKAPETELLVAYKRAACLPNGPLDGADD